MNHTILAVIFALASALTIAVGTVVRHRIAAEVPAATQGKFSTSPLTTAITSPAWWTGTAIALLGYTFQVIALGFGSLLIVQPILVLSLMIALLLAAWVEKRAPSAGEIFWSLILTVAVGILITLGKPQPGAVQPRLNTWIPAIIIGAIIFLILDRIASKQRPNIRAVLLGTVAGGIYGYMAVLSKATVDIIVHQGFGALLTTWQGYTLGLLAALGTVIQQYSFSAGPLKNSLPAMTITEPIVAFILSYCILGERFQVSGWNWAIIAAAFIALIVSTIALASRRID